jgi:histidinol-phosphatase
MADTAEATQPGLGTDLELALELADMADALTLRWWRDPRLDVDRTEDGTVVTPVDGQVEDALRVRLASARPGDAVVGEEHGMSGPFGSRRTWAIDPIDGSSHFARGRSGFATLVSLLVDDVPVVGVVAMPARGMRWWGAVGLDAHSTQGALRVTSATALADSSIAVRGPCEGADEGHRRGFEVIRRSGAELYPAADAGLFCDVAEGRADAAVTPSGEVWSLAAPLALITAAGGIGTDLSGSARPDGGSLVVGGAALQPQVLAAFTSASG